MLFNCRMIINKLDIKNKKLDLSVAISCPFDAGVLSPKVKIIFECGGKTRRLPFIITNYIHPEQSDICIVVCSYTFLLDKLFYGYDPGADIRARIDFYYGENEVEAVPFSVAAEVPKASNSFDFDYKSSRIIISKGAKSRSGPTPKKGSKLLVPLTKAVFLVLRLSLAVLLSPFFVVDGALAGLGILPKRRIKGVHGLRESISMQIRANFASFLKIGFFKKSGFANHIWKHIFALFTVYYRRLCKKSVVSNRITFMSGRRDELSGNLKFVYDLIRDRSDIDFQFLLFSDPAGHNKIRNVKKFVKLYASSRVVVIDDYFRLISMFDKRNEVRLFQLWHACGAFKTFGFTRLGKAGGPKQTDPNHRMYDYAIVSSQKIARHYAEGFGLSDECVIATGIPRTDIFMDETYASAAKVRFYKKYPQLEGKKIMLFAPTFRGNGQMSAFYPTAAFHPEEFYEALGGKYAILIKLHPFCPERFEISPLYRDFIIDLSDDDELNDLLFVADLLVTDYSSVVFEASLLDIPMLFYSFDLDEYVSSRDFYYDYRSFVPGRIVYTEEELTRAVLDEAFDFNKVNAFKAEFFDNVDGLSSQRVADYIINAMQDTLPKIK